MVDFPPRGDTFDGVKRWLLMTLLIAGCGGDGATNVKPPPVRFVLYVEGDQTVLPGPYCVVQLDSPAFLTVRSHPQVTDSAVALMNIAPGRYPHVWAVDEYDANGFYIGTRHSQWNESVDVPGFDTFVC